MISGFGAITQWVIDKSGYNGDKQISKEIIDDLNSHIKNLDNYGKARWCAAQLEIISKISTRKSTSVISSENNDNSASEFTPTTTELISAKEHLEKNRLNEEFTGPIIGGVSDFGGKYALMLISIIKVTNSNITIGERSIPVEYINDPSWSHTKLTKSINNANYYNDVMTNINSDSTVTVTVRQKYSYFNSAMNESVRNTVQGLDYFGSVIDRIVEP